MPVADWEGSDKRFRELGVIEGDVMAPGGCACGGKRTRSSEIPCLDVEFHWEINLMAGFHWEVNLMAISSNGTGWISLGSKPHAWTWNFQ